MMPIPGESVRSRVRREVPSPTVPLSLAGGGGGGGGGGEKIRCFCTKFLNYVRHISTGQ